MRVRSGRRWGCEGSWAGRPAPLHQRTGGWRASVRVGWLNPRQGEGNAQCHSLARDRCCGCVARCEVQGAMSVLCAPCLSPTSMPRHCRHPSQSMPGDALIDWMSTETSMSRGTKRVRDDVRCDRARTSERCMDPCRANLRRTRPRPRPAPRGAVVTGRVKYTAAVSPLTYPTHTHLCGQPPGQC